MKWPGLCTAERSCIMGIFFGAGGDPADYAFRIDHVRLTPR